MSAILRMARGVSTSGAVLTHARCVSGSAVHWAKGAGKGAKKTDAVAADGGASTGSMSTTHCTGLNILKDGEDPELMPDDQYPDWLWTILDPEKGNIAMKTLGELEKELEAEEAAMQPAEKAEEARKKIQAVEKKMSATEAVKEGLRAEKKMLEEEEKEDEAAKQAALSALEISQNEALAHQQRQQSQQSQHELEDDDEEEEENNIMLGIEIIKQKEGETSGTYRCA